MRYEEEKCGMNVPVQAEPKSITEVIGRTNDMLRDANEIADIILAKFYGKVQENKQNPIGSLQDLLSDTSDKSRSVFNKLRQINELI